MSRATSEFIMKIPFSYSLRNLWTRKMTTVLTVPGMALVVYVFAAVLMLSEGLQKTLKIPGPFKMPLLFVARPMPR